MVVKGGLKLKRELAQPLARPVANNLPVAQVWVDASVYHLDEPFSYLVPEHLSNTLVTGAIVSIPFHGREINGVVIERVPASGQSGLKPISKIVGTIPLISPEILSLIGILANRYAAHPFDIIRSAIPDRAPTIEKEFEFGGDAHRLTSGNPAREFLQLPIAQNRSHLIAKKLREFSGSGGVIAVLPDTREVTALSNALAELKVPHAILDSALPKSELFRNFMRVRTGDASIVLGTRSAIFAPVVNLKNIVMYNEGSEQFYERRSPGWNARDIAEERSTLEKVNLTFIGYSPSSEIGNDIDQAFVKYRRSRGRLKVLTTPQVHGELLPSRALTLIKKALHDGPVLFVVPLKGYAQAIRCAKCKTISRCPCGGAHQKLATDSAISCSHCATKVDAWRCSWCQEIQPSLANRGIDRHSQELGLLFPGVPVTLSTADHPVADAPKNGIVISTPNMAPLNPSGYAAVVILEGNRFLNQPDIRGQERVREMYFSHAALARDGAAIVLVQDEGESIATALTSWNPTFSLRRELSERRELELPPYVRSAKMTMKSDEGIRLKKALELARHEGRLPFKTRILGPIPEGEDVTLLLTVPLEFGSELISTLHEFMRRRSASKKTLPTLRIDPYSLSR